MCDYASRYLSTITSEMTKEQMIKILQGMPASLYNEAKRVMKAKCGDRAIEAFKQVDHTSTGG